MVNRGKLLSFSLCSVTVFLAVFLIWPNIEFLPRQNDSPASDKSIKSKTEENSYDPCWFASSGDRESVPGDVILARQNRIEYGYPSEIGLAEAVKAFNDENKCYPNRATLPPLTEEEIIGAVISGNDYGSKENWKLQSKALWEIITEKKMPKGSLLVDTDGGRAIDYPLGKDNGFAVEANAQRIYISLGLDKNPETGFVKMKPEQYFLVRKTVFGVTRDKR